MADPLSMTSFAPLMSRSSPFEWMLGQTVLSLSPLMITQGASISR